MWVIILFELIMDAIIFAAILILKLLKLHLDLEETILKLLDT